MKNRTPTAATAALIALATFAAAPAVAAGPPDPFMNLKKATAEVSSAAKADPNASRVDLRSAEIDTTLDRLDRLVTLTPYERTVIRRRLEARNAGVRRALQNRVLSDARRETRLDAIYRDTETGVAELLTPDQRLKLKVQQGQARAADPAALRAEKLYALDARAATLPTPREALNQWAETLQLTPVQATALLPDIEAEFAALNAAARDRALPADEARWRVQEAMLILERRVDALLMPEQRARLESMVNLLPTPLSANPRGSAKR